MSMAASAERRTSRRVAGALAAALLAVPIGLAVLVASPVAPAGASTTKPTINGTGSSYAALAINQWVAEVYALYGDNINYSTQSSVIGLNEFAQYPQVTFGASEIGYSTGQADQEPPATFKYQYLPDIAGATCLDYNVSTSFGQQITNLKLDSAVMAGIFTGAITFWDNQAIEALNPGVALPHSAIIVVYRSDASGDNYIFSDYLYDTQPTAWNAFTGTLHQPAGAQAIWPLPSTGANSVGSYTFKNWNSENGSNLASDYVYQNSGAITYVETGYAILHHDPCAAVENASGAYVKPSEAADAIALQNDALRPDLEQTLTPVFESSEARAYPISAYSYLVMAEQTKISSSRQKVEAQFVQFLACQGQEAAGELGYSPLPPNLVQADFDAVQRIDGVQLPTPTASNCPDPYVTGAFNAAPPPTVSSTTTSHTSSGASTSPVANQGSSSNSGSSGNSGTSSSSSDASSSRSSGGSRSSDSSNSSGSSKSTGSSSQSTTTSTLGSQAPTSGSTGSQGGSGSASSGHKATVTSVEPPGGQGWAVSMYGAVNILLRVRESTAVVIIAVAFLLVLVVPTLIFFETQRRRRGTDSGQRARHDGR